MSYRSSGTMTAVLSAHSRRWTHPTPWRRRRADFAADSRLRYPAGLVVVIGLYYASAKLGYALEFAGPVAAIVWLPVGVAIAFLYLFGIGFWPGVVIGDLLVNNYSALPLGSALGQTVGNLLEVLVATVLLRRLVQEQSPLGTVRGVTATAIALSAGTALSATIGSVSLLLGHAISGGVFARVWRTWWLGDLSGALLVVPLCLAWYRPASRELFRRRWVECVAVLATVGGLSALALIGVHPADQADQTQSAGVVVLLVFPGLIWSAVRLRERGATLAVALASGAVVLGTTQSVGPFFSHTLARSVFETQLFVVVASLTALYLAAAMTERESLADRLAASRVRVITAADTERRRLEHNLHDGAQQLLTGILVRLGLVAERLHVSDPDAEPLITTAQEDLGRAIADLRELAHGNHPPVLSQQGLGAAIESLAARPGVELDGLALPAGRLSPPVEATAYYVIGEGVANAQKHAQARTVRIHAGVVRGVLRVEVSDDGTGGAVEAPGSGLEGLRDRVEALGGTFRVRGAPDRGTTIVARIPLGTRARRHAL